MDDQAKRGQLHNASRQATGLEQQILAKNEEIKRLALQQRELRDRVLNQIDGIGGSQQVSEATRQDLVAKLTAAVEEEQALQDKIGKLESERAGIRKRLATLDATETAILNQYYAGFERWWTLVTGYGVVR